MKLRKNEEGNFEVLNEDYPYKGNEHDADIKKAFPSLNEMIKKEIGTDVKLTIQRGGDISSNNFKSKFIGGNFLNHVKTAMIFLESPTFNREGTKIYYKAYIFLETNSKHASSTLEYPLFSSNRTGVTYDVAKKMFVK